MKLPLIYAVALAALCPLTLAQEIKLLPSDGNPGDEFGHSVAIDSGIAIVGAPSHGATGAAYLFNVSTGLETAHLVPNDGANGDRFGHSVSISGTTAIVGSIYHNPNGTTGMGAAYLFNTTSGAQIGKLVPSDPTTSDHFGNSVGISGDTAIVGSFGHDGPYDSGAAYLFDITTGAELFKLKASDAAASDAFGYFVAISGNTAIIGARYDDDNGAQSGSAYLFDTTNGTELFKLTASDGQATDVFGWCVDISGNTAIVGALDAYHNGVQTGSAYLFDTTNGTEIAKLTGSDAGYESEFGLSVAITFGTAIVGARYNDSNGFDSGSAYLFDTSTGAETERFIASDGQDHDFFGSSVACAGVKAIVGAAGVDDAGAAYLITTPLDCDNNGVLDDIDIANDPSLDCDQSGSIDDCEMIAYDRDCNWNGIYDLCDILNGTVPDCNDNLIPDECDTDCNANGIPDECEAQDDCNSNGLLDHCEIHSDGSLDLNNNNILDSCECAPAISYCTASPNTVSATGAPISLDGLTSLSTNNMALRADNLRPNQFGVFFYGPVKQDPPVPFGDGYRCVATFDLKRLNPPVATGTGTAQRALDMTATPLSSVQAGDTRYFQFWYRDPGVIGAGYNLTDGLEITFCP